MAGRYWWLRCFWPGLPELWDKGSWAGLALSFGFALAINLLLVASYTWTELFSDTWRHIGWGAVWLTWGLAAGVALLRGPRDLVEFPPQAQDDLYPQAQTEYLRGNWIEAQLLLETLLGRNESDIEARLLLVGLLRRTGSEAQAKRQLRQIRKFQAAESWDLEITQEEQRLRVTAEKSELEMILQRGNSPQEQELYSGGEAGNQRQIPAPEVGQVGGERDESGDGERDGSERDRDGRDDSSRSHAA